MTKEEVQHKLENDPNFIAIKRFDFNISKLLERYPNGCSDKVIAQALNMNETQLKELEEKVLAKLRDAMM